MQRDGRQVTGRGYYILSTDSISFSNAELQETHHGTDHRLILAVLRGERALCNRCYRWGRMCCPIRTKSIRPHTEGGQPLHFSKGGSQGRRSQRRRVRPRYSRRSGNWLTGERRSIGHIKQVQGGSGRHYGASRELSGETGNDGLGKQKRALKPSCSRVKRRRHGSALRIGTGKRQGSKPHRHENTWTA